MRALAILAGMVGAYALWRGAPAAGATLAPEKVMGIGSSGSLDDPRGIRNNNPLNIEYNRANDWRGQLGSDGRFVIFDKPENGYRAAARIVDSYARRGITTVAEIVTTWAPPNENKTGDYISAVESIAELDREAVPSSPVQLAQLFEAMTYIENGQQPYSMNTILEGIYSA